MVINFLFGNEAETGGEELIGPPLPAVAIITQPQANKILPTPAAQGGGGGQLPLPPPTPVHQAGTAGIGGGHLAPIAEAYSGFNSVVNQLEHHIQRPGDRC